MKVIALSDLHGHLPLIQERFDLMLLAGDVCPVWNHNRHYQENWLKTDFAEWVKSLPFADGMSRVVMCAGNHDFFYESAAKYRIFEVEEACGRRLVYLENSSMIFNGDDEDGIPAQYKIFATPYCKRFGNWAFMRDEDRLRKYYEEIPSDTDILISHDAADINDLGMIRMGTYSGTNAGNTILAEYVKNVKPKYYFCGHIHSGNHEMADIDGIKMANVSIMDENYKPVYSPLIFDC